MLNRFTGILVAALLPLLLFRWFVPANLGQLDFWLLWLLAMLVVGLPVLLAEGALAARSQHTPAPGLQMLTREADASRVWRSFAGLAAGLAVLVATLLVADNTPVLYDISAWLGMPLDVPLWALIAVVMVITVLLSLLGAALLPVAVGVLLLAMVGHWLVASPALDLAITPTNLSEWGRALVLAMTCVGTGTGLYWYQHSRTQALLPAQQSKRGLVAQLWMVWLVQVGVGIWAITVSQPSMALWLHGLFFLGSVAGAAYVLSFALNQVAYYSHWLVALLLVLILSVLGAALLPVAWLKAAIVLVSGLAILMLAVFAGWQMKISHLRKTFHFSQEGIYNVWRVCIRLLVPIAVVLAWYGWAVTWLS